MTTESTNGKRAADAEVAAMAKITRALDAMNEQTRWRVVQWLWHRYAPVSAGEPILPGLERAVPRP